VAIFKSIVGTLSGKLNGTVYSHNKGGAYIRKLGIPTNPTTARQTAMRTLMSTNSRAWNGLTVAQRAAWALYAVANPVINRLGDSITLSGIAAFNRINQVSNDSGNGQISSAPAGVGPASLASVGAVTNAGNVLTIPFTATPLPSGCRMAVRTTGPGRVSQDPNYRQSRLAGYSAAAPASPVVITLPYGVSTGQVTNLYLSVVDAFGRETPALKKRYTFT
jgi:hypothetical protein